ncbi:MAG: BolA family transcriptional regulator [Alphaproteobacteria bacterium]|nr:BolA family transcriptional regulator [Alphaproteobacteria bacterium]
MSIEAQIKEILFKELNPTYLSVKNKSRLHQGHAGAPGGPETHFDIEIESARFVGLSRLGRHKVVVDLLRGVIKNIHALSISARPPR